MFVEVGDRRLDVEVSGPPDGRVLLYHHGTPGAVTQPPHLRAALHDRGLRLVSYSRAGYGSSTRQAGRRVADAASDAAAVLDALEVERCAVAGWSGGGPHALATAALVPDRVTAVVLMAGVAPADAPDLDFLDGMGADNHDEFAAAAEGEAALRAYLEPQVTDLTGGDPQALVAGMRSLLPEVDQAVVTAEFATFLLASFANGLASGVDGWVDDDLAFLQPWGFDLGAPASHGIPVFVWQGDADLMVPAAHGAWLASHVPGAVAHLEPHDGHLTIVVGAVDRMVAELFDLP